MTAGFPVTISCIWSTFELNKKETILHNIVIETDVQIFIKHGVHLQFQNLSKSNFSMNNYVNLYIVGKSLLLSGAILLSFE